MKRANLVSTPKLGIATETLNVIAFPCSQDKGGTVSEAKLFKFTDLPTHNIHGDFTRS